MKIAIVCFTILLSACSNGSQIDRSLREISVSEITAGRSSEKGAIFTTAEAPIPIPHSELKKVSVRRDNEFFMYTAFVEPSQQEKIKEKGQQVKLYQVAYYFSSTGNPQWLILARVE